MSAASASVALGLVGAGAWGRRYIATIAECPGIRLVAVASSNPETLRRVGPECRVVGDWREVVSMDDVQGIVIATPPATHVEIAEAALTAGKAVLVEKPLALEVEAAERLFRLAQDRSPGVMVGFVHLFNPGWLALKARLAQIGSLHHFRGVGGRMGPFRADTPPLWDWAPHDLAMALDLAGETPVEIAGRRVAAGRTAQGYGEVIDLRLRFATGMQADLTVGNLMKRRTRCVVVTGDNGRLVFDDLGPRAVVLVRKGCGEERISFEGPTPLASQIAAFAALVRGGNPGNTLLLGLETTRIIAAVAQALPFGTSRAKWTEVSLPAFGEPR